jgi:hypothetical protein
MLCGVGLSVHIGQDPWMYVGDAEAFRRYLVVRLSIEYGRSALQCGLMVLCFS